MGLGKLCEGPKYSKDNRIDGKVVIVTGANTGIGKATALELAKRGAVVYLACRDMKKTEQARNEIVEQCGHQQVHGMELDLASLDSVRQCAEKFTEKEEKLDILINNAGIMHCPYSQTKDGLEMQLGVNHMGHFLLTNLLLDHLKKAAPSRIVVVSSDLHKYGKINTNDLMSEKNYGSNAAYAQSKLANILFTRELSKRLEGTGVTVNALHPGVVNTNLLRHHTFLYNNMKALYTPFIKTVEEGAQTSLYAALDPDLETVSGKYFSDCATAKEATEAKDDKMAQWLWEQSVQITKLSA